MQKISLSLSFLPSPTNFICLNRKAISHQENSTRTRNYTPQPIRGDKCFVARSVKNESSLSRKSPRVVNIFLRTSCPFSSARVGTAGNSYTRLDRVLQDRAVAVRHELPCRLSLARRFVACAVTVTTRTVDRRQGRSQQRM